MKCEDIKLTFRGREANHFIKTPQESNAVGYLGCSDVQPIVMISHVLDASMPDQHNFLEVGQYEFQFELEVPDWLPQSMFYKQSSPQYTG